MKFACFHSKSIVILGHIFFPQPKFYSPSPTKQSHEQLMIANILTFSVKKRCTLLQRWLVVSVPAMSHSHGLQTFTAERSASTCR